MKQRGFIQSGLMVLVTVTVAGGKATLDATRPAHARHHASMARHDTGGRGGVVADARRTRLTLSDWSIVVTNPLQLNSGNGVDFVGEHQDCIVDGTWIGAGTPPSTVYVTAVIHGRISYTSGQSPTLNGMAYLGGSIFGNPSLHIGASAKSGYPMVFLASNAVADTVPVDVAGHFQAAWGATYNTTTNGGNKAASVFLDTVDVP